MIERKILIGLIASTEYLQKVKPLWDNKLLESAMAKRLAGWCWIYYDTYQKAPGKDIEGIYYENVDKLQKDITEDIESILSGLSEESIKEEFNADYLLDQTKRYFKQRKLILHAETIKDLVGTDQLETAEKLALGFETITTTDVNFDDFVQSAAKIRKNERQHPVTYLSPWLKAGQLTIIYGNYGSGKSLLTILVAYLAGAKEYKKHDIGKEWRIKQTTGCLYIDGELGEQEMEQRIGQFEWLGQQLPTCRMRILSIPEYQLATEDSFYLSERQNQLKIVKWLKEHQNYKIIVLDSASTLFGLKEENDNSEWNSKINPFLRDMRAMGVACIMLHHSGKDNKRGLRGASAMGAMAHNIFRLTNHSGKSIDDGEAYFVLSKDKQRASGYSFKTFAMHFYQENSDKETHWEINYDLE